MIAYPRVSAVLEQVVWEGRSATSAQVGRVSLEGIKADCLAHKRALYAILGYSAAATASATAISTNVSEKVGARPDSHRLPG